jgi:hypothetical protein
VTQGRLDSGFQRRHTERQLPPSSETHSTREAHFQNELFFLKRNWWRELRWKLTFDQASTGISFLKLSVNHRQNLHVSEFRLLGYNALNSCNDEPTFRRNISPWSSVSNSNPNLSHSILLEKTKLSSMVWVRERTIPTERPPLVGEVSANFCE